MSTICEQPPARVLFTLAGTFTLLSVALALLVSPWFLILAVAVGCNELVFSTVGECPASLVLRRACSRRLAR